MFLMKDLHETSRLFEASSRLQSAATVLRKCHSGDQLNSDDRESLVWAGRFLSEVDSSTNPAGACGASGGLSVQATEVRPSFYTTLLNVEPAFRGAGITADSELRSFLSATYAFLLSEGRSATDSPVDHLELAAFLLQELAKALLIHLTGNGVPFESELSPLVVA
jgi:hypothetical protein